VDGHSTGESIPGSAHVRMRTPGTVGDSSGLHSPGDQTPNPLFVRVLLPDTRNLLSFTPAYFILSYFHNMIVGLHTYTHTSIHTYRHTYENAIPKTRPKTRRTHIKTHTYTPDSILPTDTH